MYNQKRVIAVIPAYNEDKYLGKVIDLTKKYVDNIIVIDDGSKDRTFDIAKESGAIVLKHIINLGLGSSLKTGCEGALLLGADIIITLDGDGQHDPNDIPKLLNKLFETNSDIILGERHFDGEMPFVKRIGNIILSGFSKYIFGINLKDTQTGFRVFTSEAYKKIKWDSNDYAAVSEMIINAKRNKLSYSSEIIKTIYNDNYKGTTFIDGLKIANKIVGLKFR